MRTITATDLWKSPKEHLDAVSRGEVLKIIRSGSTVAALVPLSDLESPAQTAARLERELVAKSLEEGRGSGSAE